MNRYKCSEDCNNCRIGNCVDLNKDGYIDTCYSDFCPAKNKEVKEIQAEEKVFLWRFFWDCGRSGEIEGLFVATEEEVDNIVGKFVNFGEVLGKHSDIYGTIECGEILQIDAPVEFINMGREIFGKTWSGYNPFNFLEEEDELNEKLSSV